APSAATNTRRPLDAIADDIRALERNNAFAIGALLAEAREHADYGEWAYWLEEEVDWGRETAPNYLAGHKLGEQFPTFGNLPLPMCAVYRLGNDFLDDPGLPTIITALTEATKDKSKKISVTEADAVIDMALLRIEHGDYPDATLRAIADLQRGEPWTASACEELKAKRPSTKEAAEQITDAAERDYVVSLYTPHGGLPDNVPDDVLFTLEEVSEEQRSAVLEKIRTLAPPLTREAIAGCILDVVVDNTTAQERQETAKDAADRAQERADKEEQRKSADKRQQLPGPDSPAEIERKDAEIEELRSIKRRFEIKIAGLESEIEELKAARPSLIKALETALDLAREAARNSVGSNAKKREKALDQIRSGLSLLIALEKDTTPQKTITPHPEMRT